MIHVAAEVLVEDPPHIASFEIRPLERSRIEQELLDVRRRMAAVPRLVRWAETLFRLLQYLVWEDTAHRASQKFLPFAAAMLEMRRNAAGDIDERVIEKRNPRLEAMRHRHLVLDDQQAVEKRLGLEVESLRDGIQIG